MTIRGPGALAEGTDATEKREEKPLVENGNGENEKVKKEIVLWIQKFFHLGEQVEKSAHLKKKHKKKKKKKKKKKPNKGKKKKKKKRQKKKKTKKKRKKTTKTTRRRKKKKKKQKEKHPNNKKKKNRRTITKNKKKKKKTQKKRSNHEGQPKKGELQKPRTKISWNGVEGGFDTPKRAAGGTTRKLRCKTFRSLTKAEGGGEGEGWENRCAIKNARDRKRKPAKKRQEWVVV